MISVEAALAHTHGFWVLIAKFCLLFLVAHLAIEALSRYRSGDSSESTNHRRGWVLVAVMTLAAVVMALL